MLHCYIYTTVQTATAQITLAEAAETSHMRRPTVEVVVVGQQDGGVASINQKIFITHSNNSNNSGRLRDRWLGGGGDGVILVIWGQPVRPGPVRTSVDGQ